jgi:hypothetical protein
MYRSIKRLAAVTASSLILIIVCTGPAVAAPAPPAPPPTPNSLPQVIDNLRFWIMVLLAGVATLFLTIGGLRYLSAGGDPSEVERAKSALKSAAIGYGLAVLAPVLLGILQSILGG